MPLSAKGERYGLWAKGVIASPRKALSPVGEGRYRQPEESIITGGRRVLSKARGKRYCTEERKALAGARVGLPAAGENYRRRRQACSGNYGSRVTLE